MQARRHALRLRLTKLPKLDLLMEAVHLVLPRRQDPPIRLIKGADFKPVPVRIATEKMRAFCLDTTSPRRFRNLQETPSGPAEVRAELSESARAQNSPTSKSMKRRKKRKKARGKVSSQVVPADAEPTDAECADAEPADVHPADAEPTDAEPTHAEPTDAEPAGLESSVARSAATGGRRWSQEEVIIPSSESAGAQQH